MAEKVKSSEHAADSHMAERRKRTGRWWRRGFTGLATSVLAFAAGVGSLIALPFVGIPVGLTLLAASGVAAVAGAGSAVIGTASGIDNSLRRA